MLNTNTFGVRLEKMRRRDVHAHENSYFYPIEFILKKILVHLVYFLWFASNNSTSNSNNISGWNILKTYGWFEFSNNRKLKYNMS